MSHPKHIIAALVALVYLVLMEDLIFEVGAPVIVRLFEIPVAVLFGFVFGEMVRIYQKAR